MVRPITVVTDSCACLPDEFYHQYGIVMVPYYVHVENRPYRDLVDISRNEFMDIVRRSKEMPKTANPGPGDFFEHYKTAGQAGRDVVSIHMTSTGSGAYQAAAVAKEMALKEVDDMRIEVVDTRNVSMAHGWMALEAARLALASASLDQVLATIARMIPVSHMLQTADTLRYLYLGGRIGRATHLVGSVLNIKPIITMEDGVIAPLGQERSRSAVYRRMVEIMAKHVGLGSRVKAAIVHAADNDAAQVLKRMVGEAFDCAELLVTELCCALSVHTGPGTVGVCYFPESALRP